MKKIFIVEVLGEIVCCVRTITKARKELLRFTDELPSIITISKVINEEGAFLHTKFLNEYRIIKTIIK